MASAIVTDSNGNVLVTCSADGDEELKEIGREIGDEIWYYIENGDKELHILVTDG